MNLVLFSHGKESGPNGTKISILQNIAHDLGWKTHSVDYRACNDAAARVHLLKNTVNKSNYNKLILVGSSMGGYVSTAVANEVEIDGLFLMCPALYMPISEYKIQDYHPKSKHTEIVHSWGDTIVPYQNSIRFAEQAKVLLHLVNDNHRLSNSHPFLAETFTTFLKRLMD